MITRTASNSKSKLERDRPNPKIKQEKTSQKRKVPDVLYAEDGTTFYPCMHCCRAFARRVDLKNHLTSCTIPVSFQTPKPKALPLASMENTMNDIPMKTSPQEVNNNKEDEIMDVEEELNLFPPDDSSSEAQNKKILTFPVLADSIFTLDLKYKAKIVKDLNAVLGKSPFTILVMNNGDIVVKTEATLGIPEVQITARITPADKTKAQIVIKSTHDTDELPELQKLLEMAFGEDPEVQCLIAGIETEAKLDEPEIDDWSGNEDEQCTMDDIDETIVLEDLDIHICKQCGAVYHTLQELVNHDRYEHRKMRRKFSLEEIQKFDEVFKEKKDNVCPICLKNLRNFSAWPRHVQSHSEIGMFECTVCKKRFTRDDHRKTHEARHVVTYGSDEEIFNF